jgi:hypothetical protein
LVKDSCATQRATIRGRQGLEVEGPALRKEILESYPIEKIRSVRDLCLSAYLNQPDTFLLACYCYNKEHPIMFRRFLEQRGPVLKDPFFID